MKVRQKTENVTTAESLFSPAVASAKNPAILITEEDIMKALSKTRPSVPAEERFKYQMMYVSHLVIKRIISCFFLSLYRCSLNWCKICSSKILSITFCSTIFIFYSLQHLFLFSCLWLKKNVKWETMVFFLIYVGF